MVKVLAYYKNSCITVIFCCCYSLIATAQVKLKLVLKSYPATHIEDAVFVAGNFNNWTPNSRYFFVKKSDSTYILDIDHLSAGSYLYKLTRGSWEKVEVNTTGGSINNREIFLTKDTVISIDIAAWQDDFIQPAKKHTASPNVFLIDSILAKSILGHNGKIWIYLPTNYQKFKSRYPVLYMQDGQNLFDDYTSSYGEWEIDETLDSMIKVGIQASIVVGVESGEKRMNEYNSFEHSKFGKGEGDTYIDFIANTLKPFIDKHYRTLSAKENTIIAGSSMGGLISFYASLKWPEVFGNAGVFSPAFKEANGIMALTDSLASQLKGKLFFYGGKKEGIEFEKELDSVIQTVGNKSTAMVYVLKDKDGQHNETAWRKWFPEFYKWIVAAGFNVITKEID